MTNSQIRALRMAPVELGGGSWMVKRNGEVPALRWSDGRVVQVGELAPGQEYAVTVDGILLAKSKEAI